MARGALTQKVLDAPMERATGARTAKGLRRRMEGMFGGCDVVWMYVYYSRTETREVLDEKQAVVFEQAEVMREPVRWNGRVFGG